MSFMGCLLIGSFFACRDQDTLKKYTTQAGQIQKRSDHSQSQNKHADGNKPSDEEQCLIKEIEKEIEKVTFFMEEIEIEMEIVNTEAVKIITKLSEFISQTEELKMK